MLATIADDDGARVVGTTGGVEAGDPLGSDSGTGTGSGEATGSDGTGSGDEGSPVADGSATGAATAARGGATGSGGGSATAASEDGGTEEPASGGGGNSGASARGVTAKDVRIGVAYLDLSALGQFPQFKIVPGDKAVASIYKGWKRRNEIPVHGRDVVLRVVPYNVLNPEDQRAACQRLIKDEKVFAVVGHVVFDAGGECVARNERTPIIMPDPVPAGTIQAGAPFYFSLSMSIDSMARNLVHYTKAKGLLDGKKIGMYFADDNGPTEVLARETQATLSKLGYLLSAVQSTAQVATAQNANPQPGPDDYLAVRRFQEAKVTMAFLFNVQTRFMNAAARQGFKAQYVQTDQNVGASDTTVSAYPPDQADGLFGFTGTRRNEAKLGRLSPKAQQCIDDYAAETGDRLDPIKRESEWGSLAIVCDVLYTTLEGLKQAGPTLTHATYVQGLERVRGLQLAMQGVTSFGPGRHAGGDGYRSLLWKKDGGYRIESPFDFRPLWVP